MARKYISFEKKISIQTAEVKNNINSSEHFRTTRLTPNQILSKIRLNIPHEHYDKVITEIYKNPINRNIILGLNKVENVKDLNTQYLPYIDFDSEFYWAKSILQKSQEKINKFLIQSKEYSSKILAGELEAASDILKNIEETHGYSIWLIKNKIAFLQLTKGLEAQKDYTNSLKSELKSGSLIKFIIHWLSIRNEPQISFSKFSSQVEPIKNKLNPVTQLGYKEYCQYHLELKDPSNTEASIHVLRLEYSSSLIDYYEAFVNLLRLMVIDSSSSFKAKAAFLLINGDYHIDDHRLFPIYKLLNIEKSFKNTNQLLDGFDHLVKGDYATAYSQANKYLEGIPDDPVTLLIVSFSKAFYNTEGKSRENKIVDANVKADDQQSLKLRIVNLLSEVIENGAVKSSKEYGELLKICVNFSNFPWAATIYAILLEEFMAFKKPEEIHSILALKAGVIHPLLLKFFRKDSIGEAYQKLCSEKRKNSISYEYCVLFWLDEPKSLDIAIPYSNLLNCIASFNNKDYSTAIKFGEELKKSVIGYFQRRGYGIVSHSFLRSNMLEQACKIAGEIYVNEKTVYPFLPLKEIFEVVELGTDEWRRVNSLIEFPIILDAYVKYISRSLEAERRFAYEDFLIKNGIEKPSELEGIIEKYKIAQLTYYLRFVCIETIMDTSGAFENGSQEVIKERLAICRLLIKIDPENEAIYKQEVNDLVRRQVIISRKQEVDHSRIYVDIESIKEWANLELKESFERYIAYRRNGLDLKVSLEKKDTLSTRRNLQGDIYVPENEVKELLRFMLEEITNAYLSPDFGLDRFLSTRIRHGILEGHLRRPIENHHLITKKEYRNGPYLGNEFWLNKLKIISINSIKQWNKSFTKFSEAYDNLIHKITNDWLQVKREHKEKGLFFFIITDDDINRVTSIISEETSLKDFIDIAISGLDSTLILNLINIRDTLNKTAKSDAKKLLNELQTSTLLNGNPIALELQGAINIARTDLQTQFDKITEWFVPPSSGNSAPYVIEDAMIVAEEIIKEASPFFKIEVEVDNESWFPIHGQLAIFVDIFVNIFDNVVKRSGLELPSASIKIWNVELLENLTVIYFKVTNDLGLKVSVDDLKIELNKKNTLLQTGSYSEHLAKDRNSGLFKIHKSVRDCHALGFNTKPTMDFGIENNLFYITIGIPFRIFSLESEEENRSIKV